MSKYSNKKARQAAAIATASVPASPAMSQVSPQTKSCHFCAGVIFQKTDDVWYVAKVTDNRFPNEAKIPGGTNNNSTWETAEQTLRREVAEEIWLTIGPDKSACELVHSFEMPRSNHVRHFFLVKSWSGRLREAEFKDSDGQKIIARWMNLADFWVKCFKNHKDGFRKAVEAMSRINPDPSFRDQAVMAGIIFHV